MSDMKRVNPALMLERAKRRHPGRKWQYDKDLGCCYSDHGCSVAKYRVYFTQLEAIKDPSLPLYAEESMG